MLNFFTYSDEIVLFWDRKKDGAKLYEIFVNGKKAGESVKTFFRIYGLLPDSIYNVSVKSISEGGKVLSVYKKFFRTKKQKKDINITEFPYYAVGDGRTTNTSAIQRAIDDCGKNERVVVPAGEFLTGALRFYSDTELYFEEGGVLKGSEKKEDYLPMICSRFEGLERNCYSSLINIGVLNRSGKKSVKNVVIRGHGKIIGGGEELLYDTLCIKGVNVEEKRRKFVEYQENLSDDEEEKYRQRGRLINVSNAENVIIDGLELGNSPSWNVHIVYSDNVITCGCRIVSKGIWNGDGWDPDSSRNCTLFDCKFDTGDDCIAIKSGKNPEGNIIDKPTENINVFSCEAEMGKSHGISIGSEVSGGINGIRIWDCDFSSAFFGIHIKTTKKRGGYIKNVELKDSKISRIMIREVGYNDDGEGSNALTEISDIRFDDLEIEYNGGDPNFGLEADSYVYVSGFDTDKEKIRNIVFNNIRINNKENLKEYDIKNCSCVKIDGNNVIEGMENEKR